MMQTSMIQATILFLAVGPIKSVRTDLDITFFAVSQGAKLMQPENVLVHYPQ